MMASLCSVLTLICTTFAGFTLSSARLCTSDVIEPVSQIRYESIQSSTSYGCGFLWLARCRRSRYRAISLQVYQLQTVGTQTDCCDGYAMAPNEESCSPVCSGGCGYPRICREPEVCVCIDSRYSGDNCNTPVCSNCVPPRVCLAPETCQCVGGYTGQNCDEDINECDTGNGGCEHICQNTRGSFTCSCREGFALGDDAIRCVGSLNVSLSTVNSSSFMAEWNPPTWDSERLTSAYDLTCTDGLTTVNKTVPGGTGGGANIQEVLDLSTDQGYECCITVLTSNGNGPPSCFRVAATEVTTTQQQAETTTPSASTIESHEPSDQSSEPSDQPSEPTSDQPSLPSTDVQGGPSSSDLLQSASFKIGLGVGLAFIAVIILMAVVVICCSLWQCRHRKELPTSDPQHEVRMYRADTSARDVDNVLYGMETKTEPVIESIDKEDLEYNEMYNGSNDKTENDYSTVRETTYHYVRY